MRPASAIFGLVVLAALAVAFPGCAAPDKTTSSRQQLLAQLEHEMVTNTSWLRIHAADALLDHGQTQVVAKPFLAEAETTTPGYRIGVWRILARSAKSPSEKNNYIERVRQVVLDPTASDRLSAAETLGKINAASASNNVAIEQWLTTTNEAAAPFLHWNLVLASKPKERDCAEARLAHLLDASDPVARLRAGFALGRLHEISEESNQRLQQQLENEPADSIAKVYLITAGLLHTKKNSPAYADLKKRLIPFLEHGQPNEQLEAGIVLGQCGTKEDESLLIPNLKSSEADARIGAASGILFLLK